jgi:hypothetical protein
MTRFAGIVAGIACLGFFSGCGVGTDAATDVGSESQALGGSSGPSGNPASPTPVPPISADGFCQVELTPGGGGPTATGPLGGGPIETGLCAGDDPSAAVCGLRPAPQCVAGRRSANSRFNACKQAVDNVVCGVVIHQSHNRCQVELTPGPAGGPIETGLCVLEPDPRANVCGLAPSPECVQGRHALTSGPSVCGQPVDDVVCGTPPPPPTGFCQAFAVPGSPLYVETGLCLKADPAATVCQATPAPECRPGLRVPGHLDAACRAEVGPNPCQ